MIFRLTTLICWRLRALHWDIAKQWNFKAKIWVFSLLNESYLKFRRDLMGILLIWTNLLHDLSAKWSFCWPYSLLDVNLHVEYFKIPFSIEFFYLYGLNSYIDFVRTCSCIGFKTLHGVLRILDVQYIIHQIFLRFLDVTCLATSYHLVKEKPTYFYFKI